MDVPSRLQDLLPIWSWLPAFRAVAETEHLPTAAQMCGTGPSSLSRSLSLIERHLGKPLFERTGRSLALNKDGQRLLTAVRDAMRRVDDGIDELRDDRMHGTLSIASSGAGTTALVAPAIEKLRALHPLLVPALMTRDPIETAPSLLRGKLDIVFQEEAARHKGLSTRSVGTITRSVYCGRRHPAYGLTKPSVHDIKNSEFVAPNPSESGLTPDGWPAELPRKVVLLTDQVRVGLELCADQPLLAVLPDALAATRGEDLRRLPGVAIATSQVFAIHRTVLGSRKSAAAELAELVASGSIAPT